MASVNYYSAHLVGGGITYRCLSTNTYEITLKVYRDCNGTGAAFDAFAKVGIFKAGSGVQQTMLSIPLPGFSLVPINSTASCLIVPSSLCIQEAIYIDTVTLPVSLTGYDIVYVRCCRNPTIVNLLNPGSTGSSYHASIPGSLITCNNSAVFKNFPPVVLCINAPLSFDHSALDADGDSLVYSLVRPYSGGSSTNPAPNPSAPPLSTVTWATGYNNAYQVSSSPALKIDSSTGMITGTPNRLGQFVVGISVKEYRNGVLISDIRRDFQFNIINCIISVSSIMDPGVICNSYTVNFTNNSVNASTYLWDFGDLTTLADTSTLTTPSYTFPDTGVYRVRLIADPYSNVCSDTSYQIVKVYPILNPFFTAPPNQCLNGNSFDFYAGGSYFPTTQIDWDFAITASPPSSFLTNPKNVVFVSDGVKPIKIRYRDFGCDTSFMDTIEVYKSSVASFTVGTNNCVDYTMQFTNTSSGSSTYFWDFGVAGSTVDTSSLPSPSFVYPSPGFYTVKLITDAGLNCPDTASVTLRVKPILNPSFTPPKNQCFSRHSFDFVAQGDFYSTTQFDWDFGPFAITRNSTSQNPNNIKFSNFGYHKITLTYTDFGCVKTYEDSIFIALTPTADFTIEKEELCLGDEFPVYFNNLSASNKLYYWDFGDGVTSVKQFPTHIYSSVGVFDVTYIVSDTNGCVDTLFLPSKISVLPSPVAIFSPLDITISSLYPFAEFTNQSISYVYSEFNSGDNQLVNPFTNSRFKYDKDGYFYPQLVVENTVGCFDTLIGRIYVKPEYLVYVPNSFTPNEDGLNDVFLPKLNSDINYQFYVFNRWGEVVFSTTNPEEGWDGKTKQGKLAKQDVYVYKIVYTTPLNESKELYGHVNLIR